MRKKAVSYIRVSTSKQGASGLGLEAQQESVRVFAQANSYEVVQEFREIESGKNNDRPILQKALAHAKKIGACLLIAKLDRLARSVSFIAKLMDANTDFRAIDFPEASSASSRLFLHIMSAFAEHERVSCSERTKLALAAAKAKGKLLGAANPKCPKLTPEARKKGQQKIKSKAISAYSGILPKIQELKKQGFSLQIIANKLNSENEITRNGKAWHPIQISRALKTAATTR
jgi:DNA invertase Pin-like site-specific DNA recombinase